MRVLHRDYPDALFSSHHAAIILSAEQECVNHFITSLVFFSLEDGRLCHCFGFGSLIRLHSISALIFFLRLPETTIHWEA